MKYWCFTAFFFLVASDVVVAETLRVRSGEHEQFTRITIGIPPGSDWSVKESDDGFELSLNVENAIYDLSGFFSRIPRTRVLDVAQEEIGEPLKFKLNCSCSVQTFLFGENLLVIDVSIIGFSNLKPPLSPTTIFSAERYMFANDLSKLEPSRRNIETTALGVGMDAESQENFTQPEGDRSTASSTLSRELSILEVGRDRNLAETRLIEEIEHARSRGLLTTIRESDSIEPKYESKFDDVGSDQGARADFFANDLGLNLDYPNAFDESLLLSIEQLEENVDNPVCVEKEGLAINSWVPQKDSYSQQVAFWRGRLFDEFDRVNDAAAINLAKVLLHFGFGAEAHETLLLSTVESSDREILLELAKIIDEPGEYASTMFEGQQVCDRDSALWAVLARPGAAASSNREAVIRSVNSLPRGLKEHLGAAASRIFLKENERYVSDSILRILDRAQNDRNFASLLAEARSAELTGHEEAARTNRELVAESNTIHSPDALIQLVSQALGERRTLEPEIVSLVSSYERELKGTRIGLELARAKALGYAILGDFKEAVRNFNETASQLESPSVHGTRNDLVMLLTESASDADFIQFGLSLVQGFESDLDEIVRETMASRLLSLGLSRAANGLLSLVKTSDESNNSRILRAQAALLENLPYEALEAISGMSQPEAIKLRAKAMLRINRYSEAAELFSVINEPEFASRSYWLAGQPEKVSDEDITEYGQISKVTKELATDDRVVSEMQPLQRARELLSDSGDVRSSISDLLDRVQLSE